MNYRFIAERTVLMMIGSLLTYYIGVMMLKEASCGEENHTNAIQSRCVRHEDIQDDFSNVCGLEGTIAKMHRYVMKPMKNLSSTETHSKLLKTPNGILLHGPPGTGKTLIARALCKELKCTFIEVTPAMIENKMFGESSKMIEQIFDFAKTNSPCVIFFDEIDGLFSNRSSLDQSFVNSTKTTMLSLMDGISGKHNVMFIGTTNRLSSIDPALLRRMRTHIHVPLPNHKARLEMFKMHLMINGFELDYEACAQKTSGMSGSDIYEICKLSALDASDKQNKYTDFDVTQECVECVINDFV